MSEAQLRKQGITKTPQKQYLSKVNLKQFVKDEELKQKLFLEVGLSSFSYRCTDVRMCLWICVSVACNCDALLRPFITVHISNVASRNTSWYGPCVQ